MKESNEQYFEGILQLRNPSQEAIDFIESKLKKHSERFSVSKIVEQKLGLDLYVTNNRYMQKLAQDLQKNFGGILKKSPHLFSRDRQTSKNIYRLNICLKFCDFKKDDVIKANKKYIKITNIGKKISGIDLEQNKRISFEFPDEVEVLKKYDTSVCKIKPNIEVLHPETYQSMLIENKVKVKLGEKVKVIVNGKVFIV